MINTKKELKKTLEEDISRSFTGKKPSFRDWVLHNEWYYVWKYIRIIRYLEYYTNNKNKSLIDKLLWLFYFWRQKVLSVKYGFFIFPNTIAGGLYIPHLGQILISKDSKIGKNFTIRPGCVIGNLKDHSKSAAKIEDNVELSLGVKIFGPVKIGRGSIINANAVVLTNIPPYSIVSGNPAKVIGFRMNPEQVVEYENKYYKEKERLSIDLLQKNYDKYYVRRLKEISKFITI